MNPNAKCPVCGMLVFYYVSPDGGRVFFDELGPPRPKHPCTSWPPQRPIDHKDNNGPFRWQQNGWEPFALESAVKIDINLIELKGLLREIDKTLFINSRDISPWKGIPISLDYSLIQAKAIGSTGQYELSILDPILRIHHVRAFESRLELYAKTPKKEFWQVKAKKRKRPKKRT